MKVLITGTHFTPAQAVICELKKYPEIEIIYLGRRYTREGDKSLSVESTEIPKLGVKFLNLTTGRLQRSLTFYTIPSLFKIPVGFVQAFYYLIFEKPNVVLSFGGYLSVPVVVCSWLLSIPIIIHEQTLVMGVANTISKVFADKIALSFDKNVDKRSMVTGNPLRGELLSKDVLADPIYKKFIENAKNKKKPLLLITGGNQGSHIINKVIGDILEELVKKYFIIHQTGDSKFQDFENLENKINNLNIGDKYLVTKWISVGNMKLIYQSCDLVLSRAGINTLLELAYFKVPALVVPIPYIHKNEQEVNARFFNELGLCEILYQKDLLPESLLDKLSETQRLKVPKEVEKVVRVDAAKLLALETITLALSHEVR